MGAQARTFTIDGVVLKKVEDFKYLGRQISSRDSDAPALFMNLAKVRKHFARISNLIAREGSDSAIGGRIYVIAVLIVLLYIQKPGCGPQVCQTSYAAFIIALVGGLLIRDRYDGRTVPTSTVLLMKS